MNKDRPITLTLSGGGSRAIAYHLGTLRALHKAGLLGKVDQISSVSGGSVLAGLFAYQGWQSFDEFELAARHLLSKGLVGRAFPRLLIAIAILLASICVGGVIGKACISPWWIGVIVGGLSGFVAAYSLFILFASLGWPGLPWARVNVAAALEDSIGTFLGTADIGSINRKNTIACPELRMVFNATELTTTTAFRFGSDGAYNYLLGDVQDTVRLSTAVVASAAFPAIVPVVSKTFTFEKDGKRLRHRVELTDGGVYDNLGTSVILPNPGAVPPFAICSSAGQGRSKPKAVSFWWGARQVAAGLTMFRKLQDSWLERLYGLKATGEISGFVLSYLGQNDAKVIPPPIGFISKETWLNYPTNFSAMQARAIDGLSNRAEQLTTHFLSRY